eukprot:m.419491 g.419491  ORF g.419491 m.419491 type:complete len:245 (-) comp31587_c0_seq1:252-986(-)
MMRLWTFVAVACITQAAGKQKRAGKEVGSSSPAYEIRMHSGDGLRWHSNEGGDRRLSTRFQTNDDNSKFHIERLTEDVWRIRVKGTRRILHADDLTTRRISTHFGKEGDQFSVVLAVQNSNGTWSFRTKASRHWWFLGEGNFLVTSQMPQPNSSFHIWPDPREAPIVGGDAHPEWQKLTARLSPQASLSGYGVMGGVWDQAISSRMSARPVFTWFLEALLLSTLMLDEVSLLAIIAQPQIKSNG